MATRHPWRYLLTAGLIGYAAMAQAGVISSRGPIMPAPITGPSWSGPQFLQADRSGDVFVLRADDTLAVYPLLPGGRFGEPSRLQRTSVLNGAVNYACMSAEGDWLLSASNDLYLFDDGQEKPIPALSWLLTSVALDRRGQPIAGVVPVRFGPMEETRFPPLVLKADTRDWETLLEAPLARPVPGREGSDVLFANHSTRLAIDPVRGNLWVARPFAGRVARVSPGGRPELELVLGEGRPSYQEDQVAVQERFEAKVAKSGYRPSKGTKLVAFTARQIIRGLTVDRHGTLYVLHGSSREPDRLLLTRYDSVRGVPESVPIRLATSGDVNLAAGRDGLYMATVYSTGGRWRIDWQALEEAPWTETEGAEVLTGDRISSLR